MRDVAIIGVGLQPWGELWEKSFRDLFVEAALNALDDTRVDKLDNMYIGCMSGGLFVGQEHIGSIMADYLGQRYLSAMRVESACASGGCALRAGFIEVASGMSDIVLVGGIEKMTDVSGDGATYALATAADQEYEVYHGATFPGLYALMARNYMDRFGMTRDQLSAVPVKAHENGSRNPNAQYRMKLTVDQVNNSVMIADPLRILDCSPITDGAAAMILCPLEKAKELSDKAPVKIIGSAMATDSIALHDRRDLTHLDAVKMATQGALKMAGKDIHEIDVTEVHDCFSIAEIIVSESMGFFACGKGAEAAANGETTVDGKHPINPSGGLKSKGHPVGATGIAQGIEIVQQLRGDAHNQVKDAKVGVTQNMGGSGGSCVVHVMEVA